MRWLIDGNILLDVLQNREPHVADSAKIWKLCETRQAEGFVSVLTFANLVYVMRKELFPTQIRDVHAALTQIFTFADLEARDLSLAAALGWKDFEDALQAVAAKRLRCDAIITRNKKDFQQGFVPALTPSEALARI